MFYLLSALNDGFTMYGKCQVSGGRHLHSHSAGKGALSPGDPPVVWRDRWRQNCKLCVHVRVCARACMRVCAHACVRVYGCLCECVCARMYACVYGCLWCVCMGLCVCVCE